MFGGLTESTPNQFPSPCPSPRGKGNFGVIFIDLFEERRTSGRKTVGTGRMSLRSDVPAGKLKPPGADLFDSAVIVARVAHRHEG